MQLKRVTFTNPRGETLSALLDFPAHSAPQAFAVFAHCFTCTKNIKAVANISKALAEKGIAVLRFDFTGLGESEGDFADTNFSSNVGDIAAAARFLTRQYRAPKILIGHSFGGTACLQAAIETPDALAVATIAAPAEPRHIEKYLRPAEKQIRETGQAEIRLAGRPFRIKKQFLDDIRAAEIKKILPGLNKALLILHSPVDAIVDIENADYLFQAAVHPKSLISLDTADHLLSSPQDSAYCGHMIAEWSSRYIATSDAGA